MLGILGFAVVGVTNAFFSDTETSTDNLLQAGVLDLKIDNESYYNGQISQGTTWTLADLDSGSGPAAGQYLFFNFNDLKPDDEGEDTISLHVQNDAYACMSVTKTADDDITCTTPELADDATCSEPDTDLTDGELGGLLNFIFWADDGDNVLEVDENVFQTGNAGSLFNGGVWTLADSATNIWTGVGGPIIANQDRYIGKAWCFGTLISAPLPARTGQNPTIASGVNCDGTALNNASQTDKFMADVLFTSVQARHNGNFLCNPEEPCFEQVYTAEVIDNDQGTLKSGGPITDTNRTDPNKANGVPDWVSGTGTNFYALGKNTSGVEGWIILKFSSPVNNGDGVDLSVHEATNGRDTYPTESAQVEVSSDGSNWFIVGDATSEPGGDGISYFDISPTGLSTFQYVRITDNTNYTAHDNSADGFDLDAVDGVYGQCVVD